MLRTFAGAAWLGLDGYLDGFKSDVFIVLSADLCGVKGGRGLSKWCVRYPSTDPKPCTVGISWCG
jgi:hypothetical protein